MPWPSLPAASGGSAHALAERGTRWADLRLRMASAAVLAPLVLLCAWHGGWPFLILLAAALAGLAWEWGSMCRWRAVPLALGLLYAVIAMASLAVLRSLFGAMGVFFILAVVWCSDIGAYGAGRFVGGRRLAPSISPGKTWSGAAGGLLAAMAGGMLTAGINVSVMLVAALLGVASQLGDLGESALKRRYGVKDSGRLIPGHGGMLDRLDGLMAASIVAGLVLAAEVSRGGSVWP